MGIVDTEARATEPSDMPSLSWRCQVPAPFIWGKPSRAPIRNSRETEHLEGWEEGRQS